MAATNRNEKNNPPIEPALSPVRFNAVKHGIFSVSPVIPWFESEEDWREYRNSIFESINPVGGLQMALADRSATLLWRMMRGLRAEREAVAANLANVSNDYIAARALVGDELAGELTDAVKARLEAMAMHRLLPDEDELNRLMRYEAKNHRHLLQTLHQIDLLQGRYTTEPRRSKSGLVDLDPPVLKRGTSRHMRRGRLARQDGAASIPAAEKSSGD